jgi:Mitochondrial ribosomal protein subunit L20
MTTSDSSLPESKPRRVLMRSSRRSPEPAPPEPDFTKRGEAASPAKLTEDDVREIRRLYDNGRNPFATQQMLADKFGVSQCTVSSLLRGKTWSHGK